MKRTSVFLAVLWAIVLVYPALGQTERKSEAEPAEWVPADAIAYLGITDTERLWTDFKKTTDYQMAVDPELTAAKGEISPGAIATKLKERLAKVLEVDAGALKSPLAGPLALYVTAPRGGGAKDLESALIAAVGDAELMQKYFATAVKRLKESATSYETVPAGSETIHVFTSQKGGAGKSGAAPKGEEEFDVDKGGPGGVAANIEKAIDGLFAPEQMPEKLAVCLTKDRVIVAESAEQVRTVLAREKGGETLARTEDHRALLEHLKPIGDVRLLVNLPRIFEMWKAGAEKGDELAKVMSVIGAGSLRSMVGHIRLGAKSYDGKFELLFLMSGERTGLAKLLSMENRAVAPPPSVPASTAIYLSFNINPPGLLTDILRMVRQNDPAAADQFEQSLEKVSLSPEAEPLNLRKELIDHLTGPLTAGVGFTRPYGADALKLLLALGHRNRESITRVVSQLPGVKPRDFHGTQIFEMPMSPVSLAIASDRILVGNGPALEAALSGDSSEALADDAGFRRALRLVPKEAWGAVYVDTRKVMEALVELSKKQSEATTDPLLGGVMMALQMAGANFADNAESRKMLTYSRAMIVTVATTSEGVQFTAVSLKPKEE